MIDASRQTDIRSRPLLPLSTRLGPVHLAVTDRAQALAIWQDVVGLQLLHEDGDVLALGTGSEPLIVLHADALRAVVPGTVGLYHLALHVPRRADLAQLAWRALERNIRIAPTDHLVSEAIYLWDHDGNGIEITFETPWRGTLAHPDHGHYAITAGGEPHSGREPIDLRGLLAELGPSPVMEATMPQGTRVGHIHLHVTSLETAMQFYRDVIGFAGFLLIQSFGMGDVGLDYMPHAVAFNIWSGPDAILPPPGAAGLRWFTILVPDAPSLAGVEARLRRWGAIVTPATGGIETRDPFGNPVHIGVG